jgi:hypothetical protein
MILFSRLNIGYSQGKIFSRMDKEWSSRDQLPKGFSKWLTEIIRTQEVEQSYRKIAEELGITPSKLSRWVAGWGPLNQQDIDCLALSLGPVVYAFLGIPRPDYT